MFEKLYSVEDIAQMLSVTDRTVRNYLKEGLLSGRKVGGQWRFCEEDIKNLMSEDAVKQRIRQAAGRDVADFLDGLTEIPPGRSIVMSIADIRQAPEAAAVIAEALARLFSTDAYGPISYRFSYDDEYACGRAVMIAPPALIRQAMEIIEE